MCLLVDTYRDFMCNIADCVDMVCYLELELYLMGQARLRGTYQQRVAEAKQDELNYVGVTAADLRESVLCAVKDIEKS